MYRTKRFDERLAEKRPFISRVLRNDWKASLSQVTSLNGIAPADTSGRTAKRAVDICISLLALVALGPLFLLVVIAIKLDSPGPAIFRQCRVGLRGERFMIAKFRTMRVLEDGPVITQAARNDARVTRVGKWLRATSIDELPQLVNVLNGEMSLVGPRPHAEAHDVEYGALISTYRFRSLAKPGITGWAQINGCRGETRTVEAMQARVEKDLWYIRNWTFWLDCVILFSSVRVVLDYKDTY